MFTKVNSVAFVDDDESVRLSNSQSLELAGLTVRPFACAGDALKVLDDKFPGVIVSDISMPQMDNPRLAAATDVVSSDAEEQILDPRTLAMLTMETWPSGWSVKRKAPRASTTFSGPSASSPRTSVSQAAKPSRPAGSVSLPAKVGAPGAWAVSTPEASSRRDRTAATFGMAASTVNFCLGTKAGAAGSKPEGPFSMA